MMLPLLALLLAAPVQPLQKPRAPALSRPLTDAEVRQRVDAYLRAIDVLVEPDEWRALGAGAAPLLEQISHDPAALPTRRAQAVWGLVALAPPRLGALLSALAGAEEEPVAVRLAGVRALPALHDRASLEAALRPLLGGAVNAQVRAAAVEELARRNAHTPPQSTRVP
jgi:HEAT repeat protein